MPAFPTNRRTTGNVLRSICDMCSSGARGAHLIDTFGCKVNNIFTKKCISYINIVVPDKNIIEQYNKFANNYIETQLQIYDENKRLTELRDYLLPMLMNGQINVDDVQI